MTIELDFDLFGSILVVWAGFKTIRVDLNRFCWTLIFFLDMGGFYEISTIGCLGDSHFLDAETRTPRGGFHISS